MSEEYVPKSQRAKRSERLMDRSRTAAERRRIKKRKLISWQERAAAAIAMMVIKRGRFAKKDFDELEAKIKKMLDEFEEEWG